ncbi:MAG: cytochrome P450 [Alphaproteobacteria bacterium]|nr:cytochrome P450 [Alphaproteobacteria bacterium]MCB9794797.1 cytochrome P450 [Alphaproteobacteria bacterium]
MSVDTEERRRGLPPGPNLPALLQTLRFARSPLEFLAECFERYGSPFTIQLHGAPPWVCCSDPASMKTLYSGDGDTLHGGAAAGLVFAPLTGWTASLTLDGAEHARRRRAVGALFSPQNLPSSGSLLRELCRAGVESWPTDEPFPLFPRLQQISLASITQAIFGPEIQQRNPQLVWLVHRLANEGMSSILLLVPTLQLNLGAWSPWGSILRLVEELHVELKREVAACRSKPSSGLLPLLIERFIEHKQDLDVGLRDELVALLIAAHETTSTALVWVIEQILARPQLGDRFRHADGPPSAEWVEGVILEAMRVRPASPICGARKVVKPVRVGEYFIPPDVMLTNCTSVLHKNPAAHTDPERFNAERFSGSRVDPFSFTPFGGGARACIGKHFALLQMRLVLDELFRQRSPRLVGAPPTPKGHGIHLVPDDGLMVSAPLRGAT